MKLFGLMCFVGGMILLFPLASCESEEYTPVEPVTITIHNLPAVLFPANSMLYVGFSPYLMGNGLVDSNGTAEMYLHSPTGIPWYSHDDYYLKMFIYKDNKTKEKLFTTKEDIKLPYYKDWEPEAVNIILDFSVDFIEVSG